MSASFKQLGGSFILKAAIVTLFVILGVAGGIYLGYAFIEPRVIPVADIDQGPAPTDNMNISFGRGDLFPLENCVTVSGDSVNFETLLMGHPTLLVFASAGCEPCEKFFNFFSTVESELNRDVQVLVCFADVNPEIPQRYQQVLKNKSIVFVDTNHFLEYYNVNVYPTLVAIDEHGFVVHIQYVPIEWLEREIAERFTRIRLSEN